MGRGVDEVGVRDERSGQPDGGPVKRGHEELGVRVEGARHVEVVSDEGAEVLLARRRGAAWGGGGAGHVGAAARPRLAEGRMRPWRLLGGG